MTTRLVKWIGPQSLKLPENALENTLQRFDEYGRGASINMMADIQGRLPDGLLEVQKHFGDKVELYVIDYRDRTHAKPLKEWENLDVPGCTQIGGKP